MRFAFKPYSTLMDPEPQPFDMDTVVSEVEKRLKPYDGLIEVSVLGSARKGISEARHADFGITAAKDTGMIYARGQPLRTVPTDRLVEELFAEIDKHYAAGKKVVVDAAQAAEAARWLRENEADAAV
ncbi:MAG: flavodoxin-dependent (E)-4-hydroxy-3-methylbut-2-enyl-diphosphate synthase [Solirubrobacteraceae bacterium]